jgi:hypothetical protein
MRLMCAPDKFTPGKEKAVAKGEIAMAEAFLKSGYNVVVDDTNLSVQTQNAWKEFCRLGNYNLELIDYISVGLSSCLFNDRNRTGSSQLGRAAIETMALRYGLVPELDTPYHDIVICDIDGTIANPSGRLWFIQQTPKDYEGFFGAMAYDQPLKPVIAWLNDIITSPDTAIFLVSGRPSTYSKQTEEWLGKYQVPYNRLFMRPRGDRRPDYQLKNWMLKYIPKDRILFAIDDRPSVIELVWRANGIKVFPMVWRDWPDSEYKLIEREKAKAATEDKAPKEEGNEMVSEEPAAVAPTTTSADSGRPDTC